MKKKFIALLALVCVLISSFGMSNISFAEEGEIEEFQTGHFSEYVIVYDENSENGEAVPVYRLYNPVTGDHLFTINVKEKELCQSAGWKYEGIGFYTLVASDKTVYRLYNENTGEHFYTMSLKEKEACQNAGMKSEGVAFSGEATSNVYRLYKPGFKHMYTASTTERDNLIAGGWNYEGVAIFGN